MTLSVSVARRRDALFPYESKQNQKQVCLWLLCVVASGSVVCGTVLCGFCVRCTDAIANVQRLWLGVRLPVEARADATSVDRRAVPFVRCVGLMVVPLAGGSQRATTNVPAPCPWAWRPCPLPVPPASRESSLLVSGGLPQSH